VVAEDLRALVRYVKVHATWHRLGDGVTADDFLQELRTAKRHAAVPGSLPHVEVELGNGETIALTITEDLPLRFMVDPPSAVSDSGEEAPLDVVAVRAV
jgi:hypothetical protein